MAGEPRSESEWIELTRELLDRGQPFAAHDAAALGLDRFPDSVGLEHALALALVRTGSLERARTILERMLDRGLPTDKTYGLLGRVYKDLWRQDFERREWLVRSRDAYLRGYRTTGSMYPGVNAATMSWIAGDRETAGSIAGELSEALAQSPAGDDFWHHASRGEVALLCGRDDEAIAAYRRAAAIAGDRHALVVSAFQQLELLEGAGFGVPEALLELLSPPVVAVCTGHLIDRPGTRPRFPAAAEPEVRERIAAAIDRLDARIGYASAACGADILFIEAMKERGAEVHVLLPFSARDFIETSVGYAGERWVSRFERALRDADSVKYVTREPYLGDADLFEFTNRVLRGLVDLRCRPLSTRPQLIAVWNREPARGPGGVAGMVERWPDPERLQVVDISDLGGAGGGDTRTSDELAGSRSVRALLFADIVGYSRLDEQDTPLFMRELLAGTAAELARLEIAPPLLNTWGDAVFAVLETATSAADCADAMIRAIADRDWRERGMSADLSVRVGLHAGPVFVAADPLTGRDNCYGSHVNRAARLEPITQPGAVYCTEQFAALLAAEELERGDHRYALDYVGIHELAKRFGSEPVYRLRRLS